MPSQILLILEQLILYNTKKFTSHNESHDLLTLGGESNLNARGQDALTYCLLFVSKAR